MKLFKTLIWLFVAVFFVAARSMAVQQLSAPNATPKGVITNVATTVTVTTSVSVDPSLIPTSVTLVRHYPSGTATLLSMMYDDGTHGDALAGDGIYTAQIILNETTTNGVELAATAAYRGKLARVSSPISIISAGDTVYQTDTSPNDPLILRAKKPDGTVISYFGQKTSGGIPTNVTSFVVLDPNGNTTRVSLDSQGRPIHVLATNGVVFSYSWLDSGAAQVSALTPDGSVEVSVTSAPGADAQPALRHKSSLGRGRRTSHGKIQAVELLHPAPSDHISVQSSDLSSQAIINVTRCGQPVSSDQAEVWLNIVTGDDVALTRPATPIGNGQWTVYIGNPGGGPSLEDICSSTAGVLGAGCTGLEAVPEGAELLPCSTLGAAASAVATPVAGAAIFAACTSAIEVLRLYCSTLGYGVQGGPDIADLLCEKLQPIDEWIDNMPLSYVAVAQITGTPGGQVSSTFNTTVNGAHPQNFNLDLASMVSIGAAYTTPASPAAYQDYVFSAEISCPAPNTIVTLSIVGTDGYANNETITVSTDSTVTLDVPGTYAGDIDTLTVSVQGGPTKQISFTFGN